MKGDFYWKVHFPNNSEQWYAPPTPNLAPSTQYPVNKYQFPNFSPFGGDDAPDEIPIFEPVPVA